MTADIAARTPPSWEAVLDRPDPIDPARYVPAVAHDAEDPRFYHIAAHGSHAAGLRVSWETGSLHEATSRKGLHHTAATVVLLRRDAHGRTAGERLEQLGAEVSAGATATSTYLEICCSAATADDVLAVVADLARGGGADVHDVERARDRAVAAAQHRQQSLLAVAADALLLAQTGPHGLAAVEGSTETLQGLTCREIEVAVENLVRGTGGRVVATGAYPDLEALRAAGRDLPLARPLGTPPMLPVPAPARIRVPAGRPSGRAVLAWGGLFPVPDLETSCAVQVVFSAMAGDGGSEWNRVFREELGVTYGSRSLVRPLALAGRRYVLAYALMTIAESDIRLVEDTASAMCQRIRAAGLDRRTTARTAGRLRCAPVQAQGSTRQTSSYVSRHMDSGLDLDEIAGSIGVYARLDTVPADVVAQVLSRATFCTVSSSIDTPTAEW